MAAKELPDWLLLHIWRALLGEIYPEVRAIFAKYSDTKVLSITFVLDRTPTDDDIENAEVVCTNIDAQLGPGQEIYEMPLTMVFAMEPFHAMRVFGQIVYARKED